MWSKPARNQDGYVVTHRSIHPARHPVFVPVGPISAPSFPSASFPRPNTIRRHQPLRIPIHLRHPRRRHLFPALDPPGHPQVQRQQLPQQIPLRAEPIRRQHRPMRILQRIRPRQVRRRAFREQTGLVYDPFYISGRARRIHENAAVTLHGCNSKQRQQGHRIEASFYSSPK